MNRDIIHTLYLSVASLAVFGIAELLHHKARVKAESSRKFVHIFSGLLTLLFPVLLSDWPFVLLLCGSFALLLVTSIEKQFGIKVPNEAVGREVFQNVSTLTRYVQQQQNALIF